MGMDEERRANILFNAAQYLEERLLTVKLELRTAAELIAELRDKLRLENERIGTQAEQIKQLQGELSELAERMDASGG